MSQGTSCKNTTHKPDWVVVQWRCNFSAFNGYHQTPSDYSGVRCLTCGAYWRTKAGYVSHLRDAKPGEATALPTSAE